MNLFIAYAAPDLKIAESLFHRLKSEKHEVFLDRKHLSPAGTYDQKIRKALKKTDLLIFLASKESIKQGSYALAELTLYSQHLKSPDNRILPVLLESGLKGQLPGALNSITQLVPKGNIEAEVTAAVAKIAANQSKPLKVFLVAGFLALCFLVPIFWWQFQARTLEISKFEVQALSRGLGSIADSFQLSGVIHNSAKDSVFFSGLVVESKNRDITGKVISGIDSIFPVLELDPKISSSWQASISFYNTENNQGLALEDIDDLKWRTCLDFIVQQICTPWGNYSQSVKFDTQRPKQITDFKGQLRDVIAYQGRFLAISSHPNQLIEISTNGSITQALPLKGEPTALDQQKKLLAITTQAPESVLIFDAETLKPQASYEIPEMKLTYENWEEKISTHPRDVGFSESGLWVAVSGVTGSAGFLHLQPLENGSWTMPSNASDYSMGSEDLKLVSNKGQVWAVATGTTPSSIYLLNSSAIQAFEGHDNEAISCATGLGMIHSDNLLVLDCNDDLIEMKEANGLKLERSYPGLKPSGFREDSWTWVTQHIHEENGNILIGRSFSQADTDELVGVDIQNWQPESGFSRVFSNADLSINAMALGSSYALISFRDKSQMIELFIFPMRDQ